MLWLHLIFSLALVGFNIPIHQNSTKELTFSICGENNEIRQISIEIPAEQDDGSVPKDCMKTCHVCADRKKARVKK